MKKIKAIKKKNNEVNQNIRKEKNSKKKFEKKNLEKFFKKLIKRSNLKFKLFYWSSLQDVLFYVEISIMFRHHAKA